MKRFLFFFTLIVLLGTIVSAQTVTLTFTGRDADNQYVQLYCVVVTNHSKSWQEIIYWPDTVLMMQDGSGVVDYTRNESGFVLSQNNPNPFKGTTYANLTLAETGDVVVEVTDVLGRIVETRNFASLRQGTHQFCITISSSGVYFLSARQKGYISSVKMVNRGNGGANDISIIGNVETNQSSKSKKSPKYTTNNPFTLGDQMEYVGYAIINGTGVESLHIMQVQDASQTFTLQFPESGVTPQDGQPCSGAATVTDYDGNVYNTVQIGTQCWMKENLRAIHYANGDSILAGPINSLGFCYYDYSSSSFPLYERGYLYDWCTAMHGVGSSNANPSGVQGVCPDGWHVPSYAEWTQLTDYVSSQSQYVCSNNNTSIAKALASTIGWNSYLGDCQVGANSDANNATGFSAVPAGYYWRLGGGMPYTAAGYWAKFQSSTETELYNPNDANNCMYGLSYLMPLSYGMSEVLMSNNMKSCGHSVRCLRDILPSVTTNMVTDVTETTAVCGGDVTSDINNMVIARGICWSTSHNPTISDSYTIDGNGVGDFTSNIVGLTAGTPYFVRAYAINSAGIGYGNVIWFGTPCSNDAHPCPNAVTVTDYDNNTYNTVQIGNQCWMRENLRTTHYANGISIPLGNSTSTTTGYRYYPNNDSSNVATYGYLYNRMALIGNTSTSSANPSGIQGICPDGWHVPSEAEWIQLTNYVGSQSQYVCVSGDYSNVYVEGGYVNTRVAKALSSTASWISSTASACCVGNNPQTNNSTGFSALAAGYYIYGSFDLFGEGARIWSTTGNHGNAIHYVISYNSSAAYADIYDGYANAMDYDGLSVRCVRD